MFVRGADEMKLIKLLELLGLEHAKNTNPKSQTHTKRESLKFTRFDKMPMSLGQKREIY